MKRKLFAWFSRGLVLLLLLSSLHLTAFAGGESTGPPVENGSIEVLPKSVEEGHAVIRGTEFTLYYVASASFSGGSPSYVLTEAFAESGAIPADLQDVHLPGNLAAYAKSRQITGITKKADGSGSIKFEDLAPGLYLLVQQGSVSGFYPIPPFLVAVPTADGEGGRWIYHVTAAPKVEAKPSSGGSGNSGTSHTDPKPVITVPPTPLPEAAISTEPAPASPLNILQDQPLALFGKLVQTGQWNWPIPVLGGTGSLLIFLGWFLVSRSRRRCGKNGDHPKEEQTL